VKETFHVFATDDRRARWHAKYGNTVAQVDIRVRKSLEQPLDEDIDRLTVLSRKHRETLG
jgi:hypothetical protein